MAYQYLINTGVVVADTQDVLEEVQGEWIAEFGSNLDLDASTPQGTIITSEVLSRSATMRNNAELANQINPDESYGTFLDALCGLLGVSRGRNQSTVGRELQVTGNANTFIGSGSRCSTDAGDVFYTMTDITIPASGVMDLASIASEAFGDIPLPLGKMRIIDGVIGWGSIEVMPTTTVLPGSLSVNDPKLKNLRNQRLAAQGTGSSAAIRAAVLKVTNVTSCRVIENNTGAAGVVNGVTFVHKNAMWVCVAGDPINQEVADALYYAHQGGCPWDYGTNSGVPVSPTAGVEVIDKTSKEKYRVKFTTPKLYDVYVHVIVQQITAVANPEPSIRKAIMDYAEGRLAGEEGLVVGASVSSWEMSGAVSRELPGMYVKECTVAVVLRGDTAPILDDYIYEVPLKPFEQGIVAVGRITVETVA